MLGSLGTGNSARTLGICSSSVTWLVNSPPQTLTFAISIRPTAAAARTSRQRVAIPCIEPCSFDCVDPKYIGKDQAFSGGHCSRSFVRNPFGALAVGSLRIEGEELFEVAFDVAYSPLPCFERSLREARPIALQQAKDRLGGGIQVARRIGLGIFCGRQIACTSRIRYDHGRATAQRLGNDKSIGLGGRTVKKGIGTRDHARKSFAITYPTCDMDVRGPCRLGPHTGVGETIADDIKAYRPKLLGFTHRIDQQAAALFGMMAADIDEQRRIGTKSTFLKHHQAQCVIAMAGTE